MTMTAVKPNKHEQRTKETRELLLRSAETIFARDGYEAADLSEIAAMAGRTKGAIYAHFKSKEDIFLALWEHHALRYRTQMEERLAHSTSVEQNRETLRKFYLGLLKDRVWGQLMLEFKLFSLRHPEAKERLQQRLANLHPGSREQQLTSILGSAGRKKNAISRAAAVMMIQPMVSALIVESSLDESFLTEEILTKAVDRIFEALLPPGA